MPVLPIVYPVRPLYLVKVTIACAMFIWAGLFLWSRAELADGPVDRFALALTREYELRCLAVLALVMGVFGLTLFALKALIALPKLELDREGILYCFGASRRRWTWRQIGEAHAIRLGARGLILEWIIGALATYMIAFAISPQRDAGARPVPARLFSMSGHDRRFVAGMFVPGEEGAEHLAERINQLRARYGDAAPTKAL